MKKATSWLMAAALLGSSAWAWAEGIHIEQPWGRFSAPGMSMSGVFMNIRNHSGGDDALVTGSTPVAAKIEMHTHINDSGVMRMREVPGGIRLPQGQTVALQPGGLHVMLIGLKQPLKVGERFPLTLKFKHAPAQTVIVEVRTGPAKHAAHGQMPHGHAAHTQ